MSHLCGLDKGKLKISDLFGYAEVNRRDVSRGLSFWIFLFR